MRLAGKTAVITGAARGIGKRIARVLSDAGAVVVVCDVNLRNAETVAAELNELGQMSYALAVDVSNSLSVQSMVDEVLSRSGQIDILVNNAGIFQAVTPGHPIAEISESDWDRMMAVNLKGTFLCAKMVAEGMKVRRQGSIINIASLAGKLGGIVSGANYAVSKAGVICLTYCLAKELGPFGVRANAVAPGQIESPMTDVVLQYRQLDDLLATIPLRRLGQASDIANAVLFLASDESSYITGEVLDVNGGLHMD